MARQSMLEKMRNRTGAQEAKPKKDDRVYAEVDEHKGFICTCGASHEFGPYVQEHPTELLEQTCANCGRVWHIKDFVVVQYVRS